MVASIKSTPEQTTDESGLHVEENGSLLTTIGALLNYFASTKKAEIEDSPVRTVEIGLDSYGELYGRIGVLRYEVMSLRAQMEAFERMNVWSQKVDLTTLRRPDLEKVGRRLDSKEKELSELVNEQAVTDQANLQHVKVEALSFEEDYLRYLITEILDKGDPQSPLTSELICTLGSLKKDLTVEKEKLEDLREIPKIDGPNTPVYVN